MNVLRVAQVVLLGEIDTHLLIGALKQITVDVIEVKDYNPAEYGGIRTGIKVTDSVAPGSHVLLVKESTSTECLYDGPRTVVDMVYEEGGNAERGISNLSALASAHGGFLCRDIHAPAWEAINPGRTEFSLTLQERAWLGLVKAIGMDATARVVAMEPWQIDEMKDLLTLYSSGMGVEPATTP